MLKADKMMWDSINKQWILTNVFERDLIYSTIDSVKSGSTKHVYTRNA